MSQAIPEEHVAEAAKRSSLRWPVRFLIGVMVAAIPLTAYGTYKLTRPEPFDPLTLVNPQSVLSRVPGVKGPATLLYGSGVRVRATKCNISDRRVTYHTNLHWQSVVPGGSESRTISRFTSTLAPGCRTSTYSDPIPHKVLLRTLKLLSAGFERVVWRVSGEDTPLHEDGVTRGWVTQPFRVVRRAP